MCGWFQLEGTGQKMKIIDQLQKNVGIYLKIFRTVYKMSCLWLNQDGKLSEVFWVFTEILNDNEFFPQYAF